MGVSTDAILCYGIAFEEDHEFPWISPDNDAEIWYYEVIKEYVPLHRLYDDNGTYLEDTPQEVQQAEWDHYREFKEQNPMPFEVVRHCSNEYPMYILAVPGTVKKASRGYPKEIGALHVDGEAFKNFAAFLKVHGIVTDFNPQWLLASYWG